MMRIEMFDRTICRAVAEKITEALGPITEEMGLVVEYKSGSFSDTSFKMRIELATISEDGEANTQERTDFLRYAEIYGLSPDDYGREFTNHKGNTFKICGLASRSRKYPVLATKIGSDDVYKFSVEQVRRLLAA